MATLFHLRGLEQPEGRQQTSRGGTATAAAATQFTVPADELELFWDDRTLLPTRSRAALSGLDQKDIAVDEDDVLTILFDDGFELLISAADYQAEVLDQNSLTNRRGANADSAKHPQIWDLPSRLPDSPETGAASRGLIGDIVKTVVHKLTNKAKAEVRDWARNKAAGYAAQMMCRKYENKLFADVRDDISKLPGVLLRGSLDSFSFAPADPQQMRIDAPVLLFLHGTASSTAGSFAALWESHQKKLARLTGRYQEVWAFEHRTLTMSPVQNALELVEKLPEGATLHVVSHSRGGLVGELLCCGQRVGRDAADNLFDDTDSKLFARNETAADLLGDLGEALRKKKLKIECFVRVACPALGTTLASGRVDRWLSFFLSAITRSVTALNPVIGRGVAGFSSVAKLLIQQRTKPDVLPGLEAMMPGSPLIRMLNRDDITVESDLSVIAGHREGDDWVRKFLMWGPDLFYGGPNDWIVNTGSMYGGARREKPGTKRTVGTEPIPESIDRTNVATYFLDRRAEVSHITYFDNVVTVEKLVARLQSRDPRTAGFQSITREQVIEPARSAKPGISGGFSSTVTEPSGRKPIVVVLPGIMGSELSVDASPVWVSVSRLMIGGLAELQVGDSSSGTATSRVTATGLLADPYQDLCEFLSQSHDVIAFPYDWRLSVSEAAKKLSSLVKGILNKADEIGQPVRFLAHSMGGLVLAKMISQSPDVWTRVRQNGQARAVMLGTPLDGSWSIVQMLFGRDDLIGRLALLDFQHSEKQLLNFIRKFPGVLELLPSDRGADSSNPDSCFNVSLWQDWQRDLIGREGDGDSLPVPEKKDLQGAAESLAGIKKIDWSSEPLVYVSGLSDETPVGIRVIPGQGLDKGAFRILTTTQGDGRVPWNIAALSQVPRYFMEAEHGSLASHRPGFSAIRDLLQNGATSDLTQNRPTGRGELAGTTVRTIPEDAAIWLFPTTRSLAFSGLGSRRASSPREQAATSSRIKVSVVHCDLAFARHPVAVGHYRGDPLCGPEQRLDEAFHGSLSRRQALGLYAGELRSSEICLSPDPDRRPRGVVIVGLGEAGALTASRLERTFARAMQEYALVVAEQSDGRFDDESNRRRVIRISSLLIGTGADSLSVEESLEAMLRGVKLAAEKVGKLTAETASGPQPVEVVEIEFIENWYDRAFQAAKSLTRLLESREPGRPSGLAASFEFHGRLQSRGGQQRRLVMSDARGWWHRLQITRDESDSGEAIEETLRFVSLTRRARAEVRPLRTDPRLDDALITEATSSVTMREEFCYTLFQRMLPNALKEASEWGDNLQLILDETAAGVPWELMLDRHNHTKEPPAVASGLIRQLRTEKFREHPIDSLLRNACVIGDPVGPNHQPIKGFAPLPGAVAECEKVIERLRRNNYRVESAVRAEMLDIVNTLHRRDYRILHLAGHGVHEFAVTLSDSNRDRHGERADESQLDGDDDSNRSRQFHDRKRRKRISGMVIGPDVTLSPSEAEKMLVVPDLVFVNCCHLGRTQGDVHWPEFAANIAGQFINMGARCVVAAGWEVEDRAAVTFADEFYRAVLSGETFGRAVVLARRLTWLSHPQVNTWGAYQCYGDPGWRLEPPRDGSDDYGDNHRNWISREEPKTDLQNLSSQAAASGISDLPTLKQKLERLEQQIPETWKQEAEFLSLLGIAWSDLGDYQKALQYLEPCLAGRGQKCSEVLIRLCDTRNRLAISHIDSGRAFPDGAERAEAAWETLLNDNERALDMQRKVSPSFELLMARRNPHVRRAMLVSAVSKRREELESAIYFTALAIDHAHHTEPSPDDGELDNTWDWESTRWPQYTLRTLRALLSLLNGAPDPAWDSESGGARQKTRRKRRTGLRRQSKSEEVAGDLLADFNVPQLLAWCDETELLARQMSAISPSFWFTAWQGGSPLLRLLLELLLELPPSDESNVRSPGPTRPPQGDERMMQLLKVMREGYEAAGRQGATPRERDVLVQHLDFVAVLLRAATVGKTRSRRTDINVKISLASERIADIAQGLRQSFVNAGHVEN